MGRFFIRNTYPDTWFSYQYVSRYVLNFYISDDTHCNIYLAMQYVLRYINGNALHVYFENFFINSDMLTTRVLHSNAFKLHFQRCMIGEYTVQLAQNVQFLCFLRDLGLREPSNPSRFFAIFAETEDHRESGRFRESPKKSITS